MGQRIVVNSTPVWCQRAVVKALTGVPQNILLWLSAAGVVRSRKLDPGVHGTCVYRLQDVIDWLDEGARDPESLPGRGTPPKDTDYYPGFRPPSRGPKSLGKLIVEHR